MTATPQSRRIPGPAGLAAAVLLALACPSAADVIELEDGGLVEGVIASESDTEVAVRTPRGPRVIAKSSIKGTRKGISIHDVLIEELDAAGKADAAGLLALAVRAERHSYVSFARKLRERAVELDPDCEEAHRKLGHALHEGKWFFSEGSAKKAQGFLKVSGSWASPAEFEALKDRLANVDGEWFLREDAAMLARGGHVAFPSADGFHVLRTANYLVCARTAPRDAAMFAALCQAEHPALEAYFGFKPGFLLPVIVFETHDAFVEYAASHREPWMPLDSVPDGYFNPESRTVCTGFVGMKKTPGVLAHELVHQFEWCARPQSLPPHWIREGLACFFSVHSIEDGVFKGGLLNRDSNLHFSYLRKLFRKGEEWPLSEVLSPPKERLADPHFYDHAWSLVYFLEKGSPPAIRRAFALYRGKLYAEADPGNDATSDVLLASLGTNIEGLEKLWREYWKAVFGG